MSMSISGRRTGSSFEVVDERGVQRVLQLQKMGLQGQWRGEEATYQIQCNKDGMILSLTECDADDASSAAGAAAEAEKRGEAGAQEAAAWNDASQGLWETLSPLSVTQQPLADKDAKLFSATKLHGEKGDTRVFRYDPQYPYEMEVTHVTRDPERPKRSVHILRRHIPQSVPSTSKL
eukprot:Rhum_TRINITY_DN188_c0_g1::Rhum_TRINITY_DN188_c0_g1_i1::g.598::m.598